MDLFMRYETDFLEITNSVTDRIERIPSLSGNEKRGEIEEAENEVQDAESTLQSMGMHARSLPTADKDRSLASLRRHQQELQALKKKLQQAEIAFTTSSNRDSLFNNGAVELQVTSMDHRERLIKVVQKNEENKDRLIASRQTLEHTIDIADDVLEELADQRTRIEMMREKLRGLNAKLDEAGLIIGRMTRRIIANKFFLLLMIIVLILVAGAIFYIKFF